jgi:hypothetical protein
VSDVITALTETIQDVVSTDIPSDSDTTVIEQIEDQDNVMIKSPSFELSVSSVKENINLINIDF